MATTLLDAPAVSPTPRSGSRLLGRGIGRLALVLVILGPSCLADTLRVTTWNFEATPARSRTNAVLSTNQAPPQPTAGAGQNEKAASAGVGDRAKAAPDRSQYRVRQAANVLKKLNPDVILVQQVRDWQMCEDLVKALKPGKYEVLVCSSFRSARTGALARQQVAILAKRTAYFSWTEAWRVRGKAALPGGLAFAAMQIGQQRIGFFSVEADFQAARAADPTLSAARLQAISKSVDQLLEQAGSVTNWLTNRVESLVVGGTFDPGEEGELAAQDRPLRLLEQAGFGDALLEMPAEERVTRPGKADEPGSTVDYVFARPSGCATNPLILITPNFAHRPVTCDVELDLAKVVAPPTARLDAQIGREASRSSRASAAKAEPKPKPAAPSLTPTPTPPPAVASPAPISKPTVPAQVFNRPLVRAAALAGIVMLAALVWPLARRRRALTPRAPELITAGDESGEALPSSYTVVVGTRSATEPAPADAGAPATPRPIIHIETPGATHTHAEVLRQRALAAEQRAEQAAAVIRAGLIPHLGQWLKQKLTRKLIADRAQMLGAQQAATFKVLRVEERLARIEEQIAQQNRAYQERIEALTKELIMAKEENREIIRARITQVKAEMAAAHARLVAQAGSEGQRPA